MVGGEGGIEAATKMTTATGLLQTAKERALEQLAVSCCTWLGIMGMHITADMCWLELPDGVV